MNSDNGVFGSALTDLLLGKFDKYSTIPHPIEDERHPLKTDQFCKDRSTLDYKEVNARNQEYTQPAYVLSEDREKYNVNVNYNTASKTTDAAEEPQETGAPTPETEQQPSTAAQPVQSYTVGNYDVGQFEGEEVETEDNESALSKYKWYIAALILFFVLVGFFMLRRSGAQQNFYY